ncbi:MAG: Ig-like domain-containing protein [Desulfuromonadales bacterium]|nr:Ig-like domain-containing protein [Desulfuromonadales bacterium]
MMKRLFQILAGVLLIAGLASPTWAALQAVGPISGPHGFPLYYTDQNNLSLELCLDEGWCFFDPVDPTDSEQVALGIGGEVFWWMGDAVAQVTGVPNGRAVLVLGIEGTFGGAEAVVNGQQISFGRVRVRVDVPVDGNYTVIHPFTEVPMVFNNVTVADGINYTADIGAANFQDVEAGFAGTLQSSIGPFLTWPNYQNDPALQVRGPADPITGEPGPLLAQYVGNLNTPHVVTGSPYGNNFFRVTGPTGVIAETNLFGVMGKVYDGKAATAHLYPAPPLPNLLAVGPINRLDDFGANGSVADLTSPFFPDGGFVTDGTTASYPLGYPTYYQDASDLQLTICQGGNPMCISDPVNASDPAQRTLNTGGETFFWSADAAIEEAGVVALLVLGTEGTFGGSEALIDGQQISFGRTRIRIDTPVAGNYTVIYPYGSKQFNNVPAGKDAIKFTADIGIADPADPDYAFIGALFSEIGPNFLTWTTFDPTLVANDSRLIKQEQAVNPDGTPILVDGLPTYNTVHYVGDPATAHTVTGGNFVAAANEVVNYFRVIGPNGIDVRTNLFNISGRIYTPATFRALALATTPVANADTATTITTTPVVINVLANDTLAGAPIALADVTAFTRMTNATNGNAVVNADRTFTYTANAGFTGTDSFTYVVSAGEVSEVTTVTVTVLPVESVGVNRAQLDLRKLRWDIRGSGNATTEGQTLSVRLNSATGPVIGTTTVTGGLWRLSATSTTAPPTGTVRVYVVPSRVGAPVSGPFNVQVR